MSANSSQSVPQRETALRAFATEINDADYSFKESDDDRAPNYGLLPTGQKANRVFFAGTLTEAEDISDPEDDEFWRGRIAGPTGTVRVYAGEYQPEAAAKLLSTDTPAYVTVVGKFKHYETDDGNVDVTIRPETITVADQVTRDVWVNETAERTLDRIDTFDEQGEDDDNHYGDMVAENYDTGLSKYREATIRALQSLDEIDEEPDDE